MTPPAACGWLDAADAIGIAAGIVLLRGIGSFTGAGAADDGCAWGSCEAEKGLSIWVLLSWCNSSSLNTPGSFLSRLIAADPGIVLLAVEAVGIAEIESIAAGFAAG